MVDIIAAGCIDIVTMWFWVWMTLMGGIVIGVVIGLTVR